MTENTKVYQNCGSSLTMTTVLLGYAQELTVRVAIVMMKLRKILYYVRLLMYG